jgi:hypothetical protein
MKKPSKKKASIYLVRYYDVSHCVSGLAVFVERFFNKKDALNFQKHNGGVLTRWEYAEQIEVPRKRK